MRIIYNQFMLNSYFDVSDWIISEYWNGWHMNGNGFPLIDGARGR